MFSFQDGDVPIVENSRNICLEARRFTQCFGLLGVVPTSAVVSGGCLRTLCPTSPGLPELVEWKQGSVALSSQRSGIAGIGFEKFISCAQEVEGELTAKGFSEVLWEEELCIMEKNGFESASDVEQHLQHVVDVYSYGMVYDKHSNTIDMSGRLVHEASSVSNRHMNGEVHSRTREEFDDSLREAVRYVYHHIILLICPIVLTVALFIKDILTAHN